jgi:MFS family permease
LAHFSEAFLILRAKSIGLPVMLVPAVMIVMNVVYAAAAYPAGMLSDKVDRLVVLMIGFGLLIVSDIFLALSPGLAGVIAGVGLWGLHMGFTEGIFSTLIADAAPVDLRGTAYGMFNVLGGAAMLAASVIAGALWDLSGPKGTFLAGAGFAAVALVGLQFLRGRIKPAQAQGH